MGSGLGHAEAFPKRSTQCLVPYSENKGYASNPRRFVIIKVSLWKVPPIHRNKFVCVCVCLHIYIYIEIERERERGGGG